MNLKEVIKTLEIAKAEVEWNYPMDYAVAIDEAIKAIDKQIPKKPKLHRKFEVLGIIHEIYLCPSCGAMLDNEDYCMSCGQALDWQEVEE